MRGSALQERPPSRTSGDLGRRVGRQRNGAHPGLLSLPWMLPIEGTAPRGRDPRHPLPPPAGELRGGYSPKGSPQISAWRVCNLGVNLRNHPVDQALQRVSTRSKNNAWNDYRICNSGNGGLANHGYRRRQRRPYRRCRRRSRGRSRRRPGWRGGRRCRRRRHWRSRFGTWTRDGGRRPGPVPVGPCSTRSTTRSDHAGNSVTHQTTNCPD